MVTKGLQAAPGLHLQRAGRRMRALLSSSAKSMHLIGLRVMGPETITVASSGYSALV